MKHWKSILIVAAAVIAVIVLAFAFSFAPFVFFVSCE